MSETAQCQDDSTTSSEYNSNQVFLFSFSNHLFELTLPLAKLLSLANDDDETEQAAVVVVESLNEKILNTVDEEPARLSPGKLVF
jgi:hypothetical protein